MAATLSGMLLTPGVAAPSLPVDQTPSGETALTLNSSTTTKEQLQQQLLVKESCNPSIGEDIRKPKDHPDQDGGWAWIVFVAVFLARILMNGTLQTFNIYFSLFLHVFGESRSATALIGSVCWAVYDGSGPLCAVIIQRLGMRRSMIGGGLLLTFSFLLSTFANSIIYLVITFGVLTGIGSNLVSMSSIMGLRLYFRDYNYITQGVTLSGAGIGMFMFGAVLPAVIETYDWRGCLLIHAGLMLQICVLGSVLFPIRWNYPKAIEVQEAQVARPTQCSPISYLMTSLPFWCLLSSYFFYNLSYVMVIVLYKDFTSLRGLGASFTWALYAFGAGDIVGRAASGFIASRSWVNPVVFYSFMHLVCGGIIFLHVAVHSQTALLCVSALYGYGTGTTNSLFFIVPTHIYPQNIFLLAFGLISFAAGLGSLVGTPTAGFMIDQTQSYDGAFVFSGISEVVASILMLFVYIINRRSKLTNSSSLSDASASTNEEMKPLQYPLETESRTINC